MRKNYLKIVAWVSVLLAFSFASASIVVQHIYVQPELTKEILHSDDSLWIAVAHLSLERSRTRLVLTLDIGFVFFLGVGGLCGLLHRIRRLEAKIESGKGPGLNTRMREAEVTSGLRREQS